MNWNNAQLKQMARTALSGSYWKCVLVSILLGLTAAGFSFSGSQGAGNGFEDSETVVRYLPVILTVVFIGASVGMALRVFLLLPLEVGCKSFFREDIYYPAELNCLKAGFSGNYWNTVWVMFCRDVFTVLWTLLFIIPGIVKGYEYKMIPYILSENPNLSKDEAFGISKQMMDGEKMNAFLLDLSFIGWWLLTICTCGLLAVFFCQPYYYLAQAALYQALKAKIGGFEGSIEGSAFYNNGSDDSSYDNGGYGNGSYGSGGYGSGSYDNGGYGNGSYGSGGYGSGSYGSGGYGSGSYDNGSYESGGYDNGGYSSGGYDNGSSGGFGGSSDNGYDNAGWDNTGNGNSGYDNGGSDSERWT